MKIELSKIRIDGGTQPRANTSLDTVREYAEAMQNGAKFPPVIVYFDGKEYWLADGFHRRDAAYAINAQKIECEVKQGTLRDAILYSVGVNASHGMRRTNEDKRRAVIKLLEDDEWREWSDNVIAEKCAVSQPFVLSIRKENPGYNDYTLARGKDGKTYKKKQNKKPKDIIENDDEDEYKETTEDDESSERTAILDDEDEEDKEDGDEEINDEEENESEPVKEKKPKETTKQAKKRIAYESIEYYIDSLSEEDKEKEVKSIIKWIKSLLQGE